VLRNPPLWIGLAALACACASAPAWESWEAELDRDHPLAGRIVDVRERRELSPQDLVERLAAVRFVLLGEKHDNPDHHRLQAWLIERLASDGSRRAVALEMLSGDVSGALARQRSSAPHDVDGIARAVEWERRGWPEWSLYRPVFAAAVGAGLPLIAADLERDELARLRAGGEPGEALRRLGLDRPLDAGALEALRADLDRAHCGALPASAMDRMVAIQRARDAALAAALAGSAPRDGAILIAGAGHVRVDRGVPVYLERAAPESRSVSLALQEVDPEVRALDALLDPAPPHDYLWLTPRVDAPDPCEGLRQRLRERRATPSRSKASE
jgi:uncharacterized iron-regulated protein